MIFRKMSSLGVALFLLSCCHAYVPAQSIPGNCPFSHKAYDLSFCWKIDRSADRLTVAGYATNTRFAFIEELEVWATLLDETDKALGEATAFVIPLQIPMDDTEAFSLAIPLRAEVKPAKIRFFYRYHLTRVDDGKSPQVNSFETDLR